MVFIILVWLLGSSIIHWAGKNAKARLRQLKNAKVHWFGIPGMKWEDLSNILTDKLKDKLPPNYLVIHLGSNDMTSHKLKDLMSNIECTILRIKTLLPQTKIIWSDILQRCYWHGAKSQTKVEGNRKRVNSFARNFIRREGGFSIRHDRINVKQIQLYRHDGVHLSNLGNSIFIKDMQSGLAEIIKES